MSPKTADKHIRVPERVHDRIRALKRPDETMGEAVDRLIDGYTLHDFANDTDPIDGETGRPDLKQAYDEYAEELERTMVSDDS